jgi:hypothetical protein
MFVVGDACAAVLAEPGHSLLVLAWYHARMRDTHTPAIHHCAVHHTGGVLRNMYAALGGEEWTNSGGWGPGDPCSDRMDCRHVLVHSTM